MFLFILIFTLIFIVFIELYFGSILCRRDSTNKLILNFPSLFNFMIHPLYNKFLWDPSILSGNYPFMLFIFTALYLCFKI